MHYAYDILILQGCPVDFYIKELGWPSGLGICLINQKPGCLNPTGAKSPDNLQQVVNRKFLFKSRCVIMQEVPCIAYDIQQAHKRSTSAFWVRVAVVTIACVL